MGEEIASSVLGLRGLGPFVRFTVCLVVGRVGWVGTNPRFGDGSNPHYVWLSDD
jgi:hypothetical protein